MILAARDSGLTGGVGSPEMTEAERRLADVVKYGVVTAVDYADTTSPRVRVGIGDPADEDGYIETGWLPMSVGRSNEWNPLKVGESVVLHSEAGELQNGIVGRSIHNEGHPAPGDRADLWRKLFDDGSVVEYDEAAGAMKLTGKTIFEASVGEDTSIKIEAGQITITAAGIAFVFSADGLKHDGVEIGKTHTHTDVQAGSDLSGPPEE